MSQVLAMCRLGIQRLAIWSDKGQKDADKGLAQKVGLIMQKRTCPTEKNNDSL